MRGFTFLTQEQCEGDNRLNIIRKRGIEAEITDFSVFLGAGTSKRMNKNDEAYGDYWLKSNSFKGGKMIQRFCGKSFYRLTDEYITSRMTGARPVLPFSLFKIPTNGKRGKDGVLEVEYGYYPQRAASKGMQEILEEAYRSNSIPETGNSYTTDSVDYSDSVTVFQPQTHQEYEYNGKRYVRIKAQVSYYYRFSNGEIYRNGDNVWVEVEPVKWLVDEKARIMITEKIIFAGVQFDNDEYKVQYDYDNNEYIYKRDFVKDFKKTNIKKFMDKYLAKELFQPREMGQQSQTGATMKNDLPQQTRTAKKDRSQYNLKFDEVSESDIIKGAIESNVSIFLHGKPGCGKSDRVKQLDPDFIELNLSHLDPELLDGLAGEKDGKAVHIRPPWLEELEAKCQEEPDKIHILFLEELTNASQMMQSKAYGIALDKKVAGRWKLPENVRVVAAGNELEDSLVANEIAEPLYDRFAHVNIETSAANWLEWAATPENFYERLDYKKQEEPKQKIHPAIYAYIAYKGEDVLRTPYNREKPEPHADPRRWKMASDMLYASNNPNTLKAIIGEDLTKDFVAFCKTRTITVQDVINGNYTELDLIMDLGRQLATVSGLVRVDDENMPKVREFVKQLGPEMCKKFEVQWAGGNEERLERIQELRLIEQDPVLRRIYERF